MNDETLAFTKYSLNWHALVKLEVMSLVTLLKYDLSACRQPRSVVILKENTPLTSVICESILILMISSSISQRPYWPILLVLKAANFLPCFHHI